MKTFRWTALDSTSHPLRHSLLETVDAKGRIGVLWAILYEVQEDGYSPLTWTKDRTAYMTLEEILPLEDARLAVEKYLMDNGVIEEGDMVEYEE